MQHENIMKKMMSQYFHYYLIFNKKNFLKNNAPSMEKFKKDYISYLLKITNYNIRETAFILNISRPTLYKKLKKFNINYRPEIKYH